MVLQTRQLNFIHCKQEVFTYSFPQVITKDTCKQYKKKFPKCNTSNVKAWHSGYRTHETTDVFDPLIKLTSQLCNEIGDEYFGTSVKDPYHYKCDNLWLAMYKKNDHTIIHNHFPSIFSSCYYVDVKDNCSPILFGEKGELSIQPKNGMLLIWMGMIPHKVMPTKKKRTCICMNFGIGKDE